MAYRLGYTDNVEIRFIEFSSMGRITRIRIIRNRVENIRIKRIELGKEESIRYQIILKLIDIKQIGLSK
jgi:hypothetical protein